MQHQRPFGFLQRSHIFKIASNGADQYPQIFHTRRIAAVAGKNLKMMDRFGDGGFQVRGRIIDAEGTVAEARSPTVEVGERGHDVAGART